MSAFGNPSTPGGDWGSPDNNAWSDEVNHAAAEADLGGGGGEGLNAGTELSWPKVVDLDIIDPDFVAQKRATGSTRHFIAVDGVYVELTDKFLIEKVCPADLNNQKCQFDSIPLGAVPGMTADDMGCRLIRICKVASKFWSKESFTCPQPGETPCPCTHDIEPSCPMIATTCKQEGMHDHPNFEARIASRQKLKAHNEEAKKYTPAPPAPAGSGPSQYDHRPRSSGTENPNACFRCGKTGHRKADCTNPPKDRECHKCGKTDHISKDCPTGGGGGGGGGACFTCGGTDHQNKDCPKKGDPAYTTCNNCDQKGHMARECTQPKDYSRVKCNNCGNMGHTVKRCKEPKPSEDSAAPAATGDWGDDSAALADTTNIGGDNNATWANGGAAGGQKW